MTDQVKDKLSKLPKSPGVYFHKNFSGEIIYVGKAAVLKNRVRQYFQNSRYRDPKTELLVEEIADIDWIEVESEAEALFLEAEMIRRYMPRYNILLRDDKSNAFIRINLKDKAPSVTVTRRPMDDGAEYFGPYLAAGPVRKALRYLRKAFPYSTHYILPDRACLQYHLGLCPGPETANYNRANYLRSLKRLILYIRGERSLVVRQMENEMQEASKAQNFELAATLRNRLQVLKRLQSQVIFGDRESLDLSKDHALADITTLLNLKRPPRRIEGYDISNLQGSDTVASMVVFSNGLADKAQYRKFKMRLAGNDDYAHMQEVIRRRLQEKNTKKWPIPDLILIDGGKGQLSAAINERDSLNLKVPMIALAKHNEEIVIHKGLSLVDISDSYLKKLKGFRTDESNEFVRLDLPNSSHLVKLLQRIRDESHRFAVNYHSLLAGKRQTVSQLDEIPGIGPATRRKLILKFGSLKGITQANQNELEKIVGHKRAELLKKYLI